MHSWGVIWRSVLLAAIAALNVACYNRFGDQDLFETQDLTTNITIKELSQLLAADGYLDVDQDLRVRGNVTAHDEGENFYKTFVIESAGYGMEILEGLSDSHIFHDYGYEVVVQLNGLRLTRSRGVVQAGIATSYGSYYDVDYLGHLYLVDQHITNTGYCQLVEPQEFTLPYLNENPELATQLCGSLVRITNLRYYPSDDEEESTFSGTKRFIDADDPLTNEEEQCAIWCYVNSYAYFAEAEIPTGVVSITAIMQGSNIDGGSGWEMMLKPRDYYDIELNL